MRNNGSVTGKEVHVSANEEIISSTDDRGTIIFCNDTFCKIAGYTREELVNQPHNILRHPQMPSQAFSMLWGAIKSGKPWMGIVQNRCKNGDHYWVDAYVTPTHHHGQISGYESVRTKADPSRIKSVKEMDNVHEALVSIAKSVKSIDQMSHHIAAAEEQSSMAREIEQNTQSIARISNQTQDLIGQADDINHEMAELSQKTKIFDRAISLKTTHNIFSSKEVIFSPWVNSLLLLISQKILTRDFYVIGNCIN